MTDNTTDHLGLSTSELAVIIARGVGVAQLNALGDTLETTFATLAARHAWVRTPARYLGGGTPIACLLSGDADGPSAALEALDSGIFI